MEKVLVYLSLIYNGNWDRIYNAILNKEPVDKEKMEECLNELKDNYITLLNPNYPLSLKYIYKPPFVLFYKGDIDLLTDNNLNRIAVIGSRNNSEYGKTITQTICQNMLERNTIVIVSGLAKGIDSIAHRECLKSNGKTIAVLGNGLNVTYPKENANLYKDIAEKGLIITEYPSNSLPDSSNFLQRNRIISGISEAVVVTEAKVKSGTMNTVSYALENGKQIFCVPDTVNSNSGCNKLIKEGAKLIENGFDVLDEILKF